METFEDREEAERNGYSEDVRWKKVRELRSQNKHSEANGLVFKIREDWWITTLAKCNKEAI